MTSPQRRIPKVYALPQARQFATGVTKSLEGMSDAMGVLQPMDVGAFSNGETRVEIRDSVRGCDIYLIGWSGDDVNGATMELLIAINAFRLASAHKITVVLPMMPYARQDRKDASRQPITARLIATMLESAGANHIITMDLHAAQIQGFFTIPVDNLYGIPMLCRSLVPTGALAIVAPDAGGVKRARAAHKRYRIDGADVTFVLMHKERDPISNEVSQTIIGDVSGRVCIIVDDMADTCGTLTNAAVELRAAGALKVCAAVTHGVLSLHAVERITLCDALDTLLVTDTCIDGKVDLGPKIKVMSVATVFANAMHNNHVHKSVSGLFV
jgi:ribose-phosphate pyrophosphokinase